jgi:hypothetical protein
LSKAIDVVPGAWSDILILFDSGWYSVMWGRFRGQNHRDMGVRWNGNEGEIGYPNARGYPQWYVEPSILHEGILLSLQKQLMSQEESSTNRRYLQNIETALRETRLQSGAV